MLKTQPAMPRCRPPSRLPSRLPSPAASRRGAASLVVVMVLFFIITLVAAYASRNLLFEQRTSANQYRSTLAFETADAGIEWALARLNDARMNANCTPLTSAGAVSTQVSFRDRYLSIDATTGAITPVANGRAGCVFDGADWVCDCPAPGTDPNPTVTYTGNGPFAAFWVRFVPVISAGVAVPGVVHVQVNACTRLDTACLSFTTARDAQSGDGLSTVWALLNLRSGLMSLPAAALTVRGNYDHDDNSASVSNTDSISGGLTIHSGGGIGLGSVNFTTVPGTPLAMSISQNDPALALPDLAPPLTPATPANTGTNRMFNSMFGMWPDTYLSQPGLVEVDCTSNCSATDVNNQILLNPGRVIYVRGAGELSVGANIGSATNPVVLIVDGNIEFSSGTPTIFGLVYNRRATWVLDGEGTIQGAAVAERGFRFDDDDLSIVYDRNVLLNVRNRSGSFVKVPGGWRDMRPS